MIKKETLEKIELIFKIVGIVAAGFWAYYIFYYEKTVEPNREHSYLDINTKIEKTGKMGKKKCNIAYKVTITIKNNSKVREKLLASWYHIVGRSLDFDVDASDSSYYAGNVKSLDTIRRFPRYFYDNQKISHTIETGKLHEGIWLNPEQQLTNEFIVFIPQNKFQVLEVYAYGTTVKNDEKIGVRWSVLKYNSEVVPEYGINLGNNKEPDWQKLDDVSHSQYIKEYDMVFSRQITELFIGQD